MLDVIKKIIKSFYWLTPFVVFLLGYIFFSILFPKKEILVPNIIGKNLQSALILLSEKSLNLTVLNEVESVDFPEGTILQQSPSPDCTVKASQNIFITVSQKRKDIKVPNVIGMDYKKIEKMASKLNINTKFYWIESFYPINTAVTQCPDYGANLGNKKLVVYVSKGLSKYYIVPDFRNFTLEEIKDSINLNEINLDVFYKNSNSDFESEDNLIVKNQKPMAGFIVDMSKKLYLQVQVE